MRVTPPIATARHGTTRVDGISTGAESAAGAAAVRSSLGSSGLVPADGAGCDNVRLDVAETHCHQRDVPRPSIISEVSEGTEGVIAEAVATRTASAAVTEQDVRIMLERESTGGSLGGGGGRGDHCDVDRDVGSAAGGVVAAAL